MVKHGVARTGKEGKALWRVFLRVDILKNPTTIVFGILTSQILNRAFTF